MSYYSENAESYIESTLGSDMKEAYAFFLPRLPSKAKILDVGFGSGRDMLYFKSLGHSVKGIDSEEAFIRHASSLGLEVEQADIRDYADESRYDGIWACASLLHLHKEELEGAIEKLLFFLTPSGILYISMKKGEGEILDEKGRVMLFANRDTFRKYNVLDYLETVEKGRDITWVNVLLSANPQ